ncbi:uncharacterized protein LOC130015176 [Mercurialis annua]|uniref:uncharacterized protein LOC130015176 n=1 Tax=Mercurialis annua TaxID=3986 RepID=UPI0024AF0A35|nr:uncharacterized protein LOC130015176 [Mercurialis annua]
MASHIIWAFCVNVNGGFDRRSNNLSNGIVIRTGKQKMINTFNNHRENNKSSPMDNNLADMYGRLSLTEEENVAITLEDVVDDRLDEKASLSLVGKLWTRKPYNLQHLKNAMMSAWRLAKGFAMRDIGDNLFVAEFNSKADRNRILRESPWHFDKQIIIFQEMTGNLQPNNVHMHESPFWVRVYDLPMNCRGKAAIAKIGSKLGRVLECGEVGNEGWSRFERIRVMVDVSRPICWIPFKYERIQNYCYWCGCLDHTITDCETKPDQTDVSEWPYGPMLRATPRKRSLMGGRQAMSGDGYTGEKRTDEGMNEQTTNPGTVRRSLNLNYANTIDVTEILAENVNIIESEMGRRNIVDGGSAKKDNFLASGDFVEISVAQVQNSNQIIDSSKETSKTSSMGKKDKSANKGSWTRLKGKRDRDTDVGTSSGRSGATKRPLGSNDSVVEENNLFSKKARDGLTLQFENFEISAETVDQSRRMQ